MKKQRGRRRNEGKERTATKMAKRRRKKCVTEAMIEARVSAIFKRIYQQLPNEKINESNLLRRRKDKVNMFSCYLFSAGRIRIWRLENEM